MAWIDSISDTLSRYTGAGGGAVAAPADPHQDYCNISRSAPKQVMADALAHTFRSDQTPSFSEMVSNLFRASNPNQRAGVLNSIVGAAGAGALASVPAMKNLSGGSSAAPNVTPETASRVSAEQVQQIADQAERANPSVVDRVSGFYAQHPDVVKALGGLAISVAIQHIARQKA